MLKRLVVAGAIACIPASAHAVTTTGAGVAVSCGKWLADHRDGIFSPLANWTLGYLSGAANYSETLDPLHGVDADGVFYWIDNYCQQHPLTQLKAAADAFIHEHPH
jgi:hypothetical protein